MKYRFTQDHFRRLGALVDSDGFGAEAYFANIAREANTLLEQWEKESEVICGRYDPVTKRLGAWITKGPVKLKREDYTHRAYVWNPKEFEK